MLLEVKVALNFIVSYLYNKLPRRRADLFGEELERILVSRFEGHWYPESPLRGSAFRCLHLGAPRDPLVELAARRSGLDTEEVRANVPAELSVWIDPYEVSYQIGEKGAVKVLYLEDPPGLGGGDGERAEGVMTAESIGDMTEGVEEARTLGFNPEAQVFVPIGGQVSPVLLPSLSSSPTLPCMASQSSCPLQLFSYPSSSTPTNATSHSSNTSTPSPPNGGLPYLCPTQQQQQQPPTAPRPPVQPITFTTASFAATKFGSTKMKKGGSSTGGSTGGSSAVVAGGPGPPQRMLSRSPTVPISPPELLLKHKPLSLSLHSLGGAGPVPSQLSPNAKEFVYPGSPGPLYFDAAGDSQPMPPPPHASPFQPPPPHHQHAVVNSHPSFDPFSSPPPAPGGVGGLIGGNGGISYMEKPSFVEGLGSYNLQYPSQSFQPVVLAN